MVGPSAAVFWEGVDALKSVGMDKSDVSKAMCSSLAARLVENIHSVTVLIDAFGHKILKTCFCKTKLGGPQLPVIAQAVKEMDI